MQNWREILQTVMIPGPQVLSWDQGLQWESHKEGLGRLTNTGLWIGKRECGKERKEDVNYMHSYAPYVGGFIVCAVVFEWTSAPVTWGDLRKNGRVRVKVETQHPAAPRIM